MKKLAAILSLVALLAGCSVKLPPVEAGFVGKTWMTLDTPGKTPLSASQLEALSAWFASRQSGWKYEVTDTPAGTLMLFKHRGSKVTFVNLQGGKLWVGNRSKILSGEDQASLVAILAFGNGVSVTY